MLYIMGIRMITAAQALGRVSVGKITLVEKSRWCNSTYRNPRLSTATKKIRFRRLTQSVHIMGIGSTGVIRSVTVLKVRRFESTATCR